MSLKVSVSKKKLALPTALTVSEHESLLSSASLFILQSTTCSDWSPCWASAIRRDAIMFFLINADYSSPSSCFSRMNISLNKSRTISSSSSFNKYYTYKLLKPRAKKLIKLVIYLWINYGLNVLSYSIISNPQKSCSCT